MASRISLRAVAAALLNTEEPLRQACHAALVDAAERVRRDASEDLQLRADRLDDFAAGRLRSLAASLETVVAGRAIVGVPEKAGASAAGLAVGLEFGDATGEAAPFLARAAAGCSAEVVKTIAGRCEEVLRAQTRTGVSGR